jgi:predicted RNA-binding protein associated with RNAse of E/G family
LIFNITNVNTFLFSIGYIKNQDSEYYLDLSFNDNITVNSISVSKRYLDVVIPCDRFLFMECGNENEIFWEEVTAIDTRY